MEIRPVASPDARSITPHSVRAFAVDDLLHVPPLPLPAADVQPRLKEAGRVSGFFMMSAARTGQNPQDMALRDAVYSVQGMHVIDDYPQAPPLNLTRTHIASMATMAMGEDERHQMTHARIIDEWERPSANHSLSTAQVHKTIIAYDTLERESQLDLYIAKTAHDAVEVSVFQHQAATTPQLFPYKAGPLYVESFGFDPVQGIRNGHYPYPLPAIIPAERALKWAPSSRDKLIFACIGGCIILMLLIKHM